MHSRPILFILRQIYPQIHEMITYFFPSVLPQLQKKGFMEISLTSPLVCVRPSRNPMTVETTSPVTKTYLYGSGPCQPPLTSYYAHDS